LPPRRRERTPGPVWALLRAAATRASAVAPAGSLPWSDWLRLPSGELRLRSCFGKLPAPSLLARLRYYSNVGFEILLNFFGAKKNILDPFAFKRIMWTQILFS
jgi:hypothetical protein